MGVPEGEEEEQEIENLFEKIMKESFPNLAKEIDFQEVQEAQRVPKKLARKHTPKHIMITLPKMKGKKRILKAATERETDTYKAVPMRLSADFLKETLQARRDCKELFEVRKTSTYIQDCSIQQNYHLEWKGRRLSLIHISEPTRPHD